MMAENENDRRFAVDNRFTPGLTGETVSVPLRLFRHCDLLSSIHTAPIIKQKDLINTLHHIHFTNGSVLVHITDPKYAEDLLIRCRLESCQANEVHCLWPEGVSYKSRLLHVIMEDGLSLLLFPIRLTGLDEKGFSVALPAEGHLLGKRKIRRHLCDDVRVDLMQNGFTAQGKLVDFTPTAFHICFPPSPKAAFLWINPDESFTVCLKKGDRILFSGPCRCLRQLDDTRIRELVLIPQEQAISRFRKKKTRTPRLNVIPPPITYFEHPLFKQAVQRDIDNLTFAGFVVEERQEDSVLMPGMIIPGLEIRFAESLKMTCDVQVIYRRKTKKDLIRCGVAILDMNFRDYRNLSHIMVHAGDPQARFNSDIEAEPLWKFLFTANFIYPKKYHLLQAYREEFKETYRKMCNNQQEIEAHFTYQENGMIYGYISILRAYQRTWMWHHLAATPLNGKRTGIRVLRNIHRFADGLGRYPSSLMDYMIAYFRPDNYFPELLFGGFARKCGNPRVCSIDRFAYLNHPNSGQHLLLPQGWQLSPLTDRHLPELETYYRNVSGGLLLDVLHLHGCNDGEEALEEVYRRHGLFRHCQLHVLSKTISNEEVKAVFIVNRSSPGLNLSEVLNCIKIIVLDPADLPGDVLKAALDQMSGSYVTDNIPVLIYPSHYPAEQGFKIVREYDCWILDTQHIREYLEFMENKTKITFRSILMHYLKKLKRLGQRPQKH
jgi:hypothetical protein